ncbi:MAG: protein-disulfide reductase DsbD family protein [Verrucomicrobiota bacterium]|nr:protein-disulfide reductase DsbD family protein [Limisphaera sp.]MDW8381392.1 protein-disulfide reductase DsbD family protein [Verrucomicrobiota bacterium]
MNQLRVWLVSGCFLLSLSAQATLAAHTQARLVLSQTEAPPGSTVWTGIHLRMDPGWHTYWRNPGSSGLATEVQWELPEGITAGAIHWPPPEKYGEDDLTTYVYHEEVVLLVPLTLAQDIRPGRYELRARVSWLECKEVCLPGSAQVSAFLLIGSRFDPSAEHVWLEQWRERLPKDGAALGFGAWWDAPASTGSRMRPVVLEWKKLESGPVSWDFFPFAAANHEVKAPTTFLPSEAALVRVRKQVESFTSDWPEELAGLVVVRGNDRVRAWEVRAKVQEWIGGARSSGQGSDLAPAVSLGLARVLVYAFVGGLILNVMPCVLPVIALKILGFVRQAREDPRRVRFLGLIYTLGVLASFALLAGLVIGLQWGGRQAGWGIQFGNPYFLVGMTVLVTLVALNLFGVYEVTLSGQALSRAAGLVSQEGAAGAFFSGLLTTVLATSCTAPFLGVAVGFAFAQPPWVVVLVLLTVGAGLAFPYLALSWQPGWLRWLPKPGVWMEHFKVAMGFPMMGAVVWLLSLVEAHYGERTWYLAYFLVLLAVATWLFGVFWQRRSPRRVIALCVAILFLAAGYIGLLEGSMRWREPERNSSTTVQNAADGIAWRPWSPEAVERARREGRVVLVDFTARWCLTCQMNKKFALEVPSVREKLRALDVVTLQADYTHFPENITQELQRFGRAGVPLVVVYPSNPAREPLVLPEALTAGIVLDALERASQE